MTTGPKRRVTDTSGRSVGNIYARLEDARKKRAEVLATPKPANDGKPKPASKTAPAADKNAKAAVKSRKDAKERLPAIKPPEVEPALVPVARKRRSFLHLGIVALILVILAISYGLRPVPQPTIPDNAAALSDPPLSQPSAPPVPARESSPRQRPATSIATDMIVPPLPRTDAAAPEPHTPTQAVLTVPPAASEPPKPRPVLDDVLSRKAAPDLLASPPTAGVPVVSYRSAPPDLRVALHVPASTSIVAINSVRAGAKNLGLDIRDPRIVDFAIKSTHVRYFHAEDRADALTLAEAIGADLRDFTFFDPSPSAGYVELWVSGRARASQSKPAGQNIITEFGRDLRQFGSDARGALRAISR